MSKYQKLYYQNAEFAIISKVVSFLCSHLRRLADNLWWCACRWFQRYTRQRKSHSEWRVKRYFPCADYVTSGQLEFFPPKGSGQPINSQFLLDAMPSNLFPHVRATCAHLLHATN